MSTKHTLLQCICKMLHNPKINKSLSRFVPEVSSPSGVSATQSCSMCSNQSQGVQKTRNFPTEARLDMLLLVSDTLSFSNRRSRHSGYSILFHESQYRSFCKQRINHMCLLCKVCRQLLQRMIKVSWHICKEKLCMLSALTRLSSQKNQSIWL